MPAGLGPAEPAITTLIGPGAPPPTPGLHTCTEHRSDFGLIIIAYTHTHPFNSPLSGTTRVSWYQKGKTSLDFTEATNSEWQWNPLGHMQACTLLQTDNHTSTYHSVFLQAGCPSCRQNNSIKALKTRDDFRQCRQGLDPQHQQ